MFNPSSVVIEAFLDELVTQYFKVFGNEDTEINDLVSNARNALEIISNSDAPYHDADHTIMVTLVGLQIIRGKILLEGNISPADWVMFVISLLHHDIGYIRGICKADRSGRYTINKDGDTIKVPPGATDAFLTPYHVDRAKLFISERFKHDKIIDVETVCLNIERTRFPVPTEDDHQCCDDIPGLIRAADLIGQLADPQYLRKTSSLFYEFNETGTAERMGYTNASDVRGGYPKFFWETVSPYIQEGLRYLRRTQEGQQWAANLYANVFTEEHDIPAYGPERRNTEDRREEFNTPFTAKVVTDDNLRKDHRRKADASE